MRGLKIILPLFLTLFCVVCSAAETDSGYSQFWSTFRQAVLDNDKVKIVEMTRFPFEVRGPDDSDPVQPYDHHGFLSIYEKLVAQPVFLPSDGKIISKTMRQLIDEKKEITPADHPTSDSFQVHQFEFRRIKGKWFFTRAYLEE